MYCGILFRTGNWCYHSPGFHARFHVQSTSRRTRKPGLASYGSSFYERASRPQRTRRNLVIVFKIYVSMTVDIRLEFVLMLLAFLSSFLLYFPLIYWHASKPYSLLEIPDSRGPEEMLVYSRADICRRVTNSHRLDRQQLQGSLSGTKKMTLPVS